MASAIVVFERQRHSNGRDDAFVMPDPTELPALARQLHGRGVRRLLVVVPHAPALLPQALSHGLASLDEAAVAALGFEQLVFLRASQSALASPQGNRLERFAAWWLSQLAWMVPQRQQPVRAVVLARCVVQLARLLPLLAPGTRVIAPETLWRWAQHEEGLDVALARELGLVLEPAGAQASTQTGAPADRSAAAPPAGLALIRARKPRRHNAAACGPPFKTTPSCAPACASPPPTRPSG